MAWRERKKQKQNRGRSRRLKRCSRNKDLVEKLSVIRVIKAKFVIQTPFDPIRIARSLPSHGEQRLFTSIYRNINLAGALAQGVPRNGRPAFCVPRRHWIWRSGKNRRDFAYENNERCDMYAFEL